MRKWAGLGALAVCATLVAAAPAPGLAASSSAGSPFTDARSAAGDQYGTTQVTAAGGVLGSVTRAICISRRMVRISLPHFRLRPGEHVIKLSGFQSVTGRTLRLRRHGRFTEVSLVGLTGLRGVRVFAVVRTNFGRVFRRSTVFHTCEPRRPGSLQTARFHKLKVHRSSYTVRSTATNLVMLLLALGAAGAFALAGRRVLRRGDRRS